MLDAWARGKRRSHREYEDEIFSVVVGHLQYFPCHERAEVFIRLLGEFLDKENANERHAYHVRECDVCMWPNITSNGSSRIEPDAVVRIRYEGGRSDTIIIEAKWGSPQSKGQLSKQWNAAKARYPRDNVWHVYLTRGIETAEKMLDGKAASVHAEYLRSITWGQFSGLLQMEKSRVGPEFNKWASQVQKFLSRLGQAPFIGVFAACKLGQHGSFLVDLSEPRWKYRMEFFRVKALLGRHESFLANAGSGTWKFKTK